MDAVFNYCLTSGDIQAQVAAGNPRG